MKTSLLLAVAVFAAASFLSSCQQDPQSANSGINLPLKSSPPPADPVIAYVGDTTIKGNTYITIGVMDSTGANQTNVVRAPSNYTVENFLNPSWNYDGASIVYFSAESASWAINTVDISVNSKGVPVASNAQTIYSLTSSDSDRIQSGPAWCATSSVGEIAFTRLHTSSSQYGVTDLCTISQSGGTPTVLASFKKVMGTVCLGLYENPTWSPDDSKIAVLRQDTTLHFTILIFNSSTGAAEDSIPISGSCRNLEWSNSGMNELAYMYTPNSSTPWELYYVAPSTGSTPTTNSVECTGPTWSPNNSGIAYLNLSTLALTKVVTFTSSTTTVASTTGVEGDLNWVR